MINLTKVSKQFSTDAGEVAAVNSISLSIGEGQFVSIIGRSGSGKSTLLAMLGGLDRPTSGSLKINNKEVGDLSDRDLIGYRQHDVGFVFQNYNLVPNLTALENVLLPMEFAKILKADRKERAVALLEQVGLDAAKQNRKPGRLSGGEQQRVAIARALANKPKIILADEPTGNLDSETGKKIFDLLHSLSRSEKTTIVVVTHDLSIAGKTDLSFKLADGKLVKS